jgi:hypothetical protein
MLNPHRWPANEKQPESEEARPVHKANAPPKAVADLVPKWWKRGPQFASVFSPGSQIGGATINRSELKSLTQNPNAVMHWTALLRGR